MRYLCSSLHINYGENILSVTRHRLKQNSNRWSQTNPCSFWDTRSKRRAYILVEVHENGSTRRILCIFGNYFWCQFFHSAVKMCLQSVFVYIHRSLYSISFKMSIFCSLQFQTISIALSSRNSLLSVQQRLCYFLLQQKCLELSIQLQTNKCYT